MAVSSFPTTLGRLLPVALSVALLATACAGSVAGVYRSERGLKTLELRDDRTFRMDLGPVAAGLAEGPIVLNGRYEVQDDTIRLVHQGNVIDEGTIEGDQLVLDNGVFVRL